MTSEQGAPAGTLDGTLDGAAFPGEALLPDPAAMRRVCGHFATGVTVVTALAEGRWIGATVNSFTSVSLDPPWVLFCLRHDSRLLTAIRAGGRFAVSILAAGQGGVAMDFAAEGLPAFDGLDCLTGATGAPILRGSVGYLECRLAEEYAGGDHRIVVGAVTALGVLDDDAAGRRGPLTFYRGRLARLDKECER
jgi:flavin reductase (DIM6/NTAB) family NADH-FMN oxidoreductase RutF